MIGPLLDCDVVDVIFAPLLCPVWCYSGWIVPFRANGPVSITVDAGCFDFAAWREFDGRRRHIVSVFLRVPPAYGDSDLWLLCRIRRIIILSKILCRQVFQYDFTNKKVLFGAIVVALFQCMELIIKLSARNFV